MPLEAWAELLEPGIDMSGATSAGIVKGVSIDSRTIRQGDVFFAIQGERFDGHQFLENAFAGGAEAAVVSRTWAPAKGHGDRSVIRSSDPLHSLQIMAGNYRRIFDIPVIGLTGTNGKTTTKEMIADVIAQKNHISKSSGNLNNHIGLPLSLMQINATTEIAIMEMGMNQPGEIEALCQIAGPTLGLVTNIGPGHIGNFDNIGAVAREKTALYRYLRHEDLAFINIDDPHIAKTAQTLTARKLTYGLDPGADVFAEIQGYDHLGCLKFRLQGQTDVHLSVPGKYQIHNALAAAAVGSHFEVPFAQITAALESFRGVAKRMELMPFRRALIVVDTYNSNPESMQSSLETAAFIAKERGGRMLAVLGDMLELGRDSEKYHAEAGRVAAANGVIKLFLFGPESEATAAAFRAHGGEWVANFADKSALARAVAAAIKPDDVILIKGSRGMEMEAVMEELLESNQPQSKP